LGALVYLVGASLLARDGVPVEPAPLALGLGAVLSAQLMTHFLNEYFDYESDISSSRTTFSGGSGVLAAGVFTRTQCLGFGIASLVLGLVLGVALLAAGGRYFLADFALIVALAIEYSAPPLRLVASGLGEPAASLVISILAPLAPLLAEGVPPSLIDVVRLFPLFIFMCATMLSVEAPDLASDVNSGKTNAVVRLGLVRSSSIYPALVVAALASLSVVCLSGMASLWALPVAALALPPFAIETRMLRNAARSGKEASGAFPGAVTFALFSLAVAAGLLIA
jgi:1,4-dihydroxy-2-naphthoate octaprenyltransferase